jgi:4-amino-4-deoxy-L-arabinose transferase-like glycosyltransferase
MTSSDTALSPALRGAKPAEWRDISRHPTDNAPPNRTRFPHRSAHALLLLGTGVLYLVGLSASGWANQYYAAAVQAGSTSWKAMLFGSLDASNYITVDKPPASLWVMDLSARIFGVNSWSLLVPQALEGVAAVALLYAAVRRVSGPTAGLLAGAALATTPAATLMFRYDNPDALLVLLLTAAAYATVRATQTGRLRWLVLAGSLVGFGFLTKMLQAFLVLPALALAYLICAPNPLRRRILHVLAAGGALIVSAGWWVALVELWPAGSRPYIGGSTNNSVVELIFGYNGVGRLTGSNNNGAPGGAGGTGATGAGGFSSGQTGLARLFASEMGTQISWLLPTALLALVAIGWLTWRRGRTDALRASAIVWGGWLLVTGVVFSFASGIIHPYYTVALAPAIAALTGIGVVELWRARHSLVARVMLAVTIAVTAVWTVVLLGRADWHPALRWAVLVAASLAAGLVLVERVRVALVAPVVALALLLAPTAYSIDTAATAHTGSLPTAGPSSSRGFGGPGGGGFPGGGFPGGGFPGGGAPAGAGRGTFPGGARPGGSVGAFPGGGLRTGRIPGHTTQGGPGRTGQGGGMPGGLGGASSVSSALRSALQRNASAYRWVAATTSANEAASLELATGQSVMALGGFNGSDPAITLTQFQKLVAAGEIHYYLADGQGFIGSTAASVTDAYRIQQWVEKTFTATTVGGSTVYDLTSRT